MRSPGKVLVELSHFCSPIFTLLPQKFPNSILWSIQAKEKSSSNDFSNSLHNHMLLIGYPLPTLGTFDHWRERMTYTGLRDGLGSSDGKKTLFCDHMSQPKKLTTQLISLVLRIDWVVQYNKNNSLVKDCSCITRARIQNKYLLFLGFHSLLTLSHNFP